MEKITPEGSVAAFVGVSEASWGSGLISLSGMGAPEGRSPVDFTTSVTPGVA